MELNKTLETQELTPNTDRMVRFKKIKKFFSLEKIKQQYEVKENGSDTDNSKHD